jgi:transcription elongation GreA/GreB family factor
MSGIDAPASDGRSGSAEQAEAERFNAARIEKELEQMKAERAELEARLAELEALVKSLAVNPSTPNQFNSYEAGAGVIKLTTIKAVSIAL